MRPGLAIGGLMAAMACGHSEPFTTAEQRNDGPFATARPVQLTYSSRADEGPAFSTDGRWISYTYERSDNADRCVGILPVGGGTRRWSACEWRLDRGGSKDGLAGAALRDDGMLVFVQHAGMPGSLNSPEAALYLAPVDSIPGARHLLTLGQRPAGGTAAWGDLIEPRWIDADMLMALAARRHLVNANDCPSCIPPRDRDRTPVRDTVPVGIELARLRISASGVAVEATIPAEDAIAWSIDRSNGTIYLVIQRPRPDLADTFHESLADSVFAVPLGGGPRTLRYGTAGLDAAPLERLHGVASGHGRLFISRSWRPNLPPGPTVPVGTTLLSEISEVLPDGSLRTIAPAISWRWGRLDLSPDGRFLVAEAVERTTSDIYLLELDP